MTPKDKPDETVASPRAETHGEFSIFMPEPAKHPGLAARQVLLAGVAAACLLGVGLGLWARPAMSERQASIATPATAPPKAAPAARRLAIVVDDRPAPLGAPIDVLPKAGAPPLPAASQLARPMASPPVRLPEGLMRVQNILSPTSAPSEPAPAAAPAPDRKAALAPLAATAASAFAAAKLMLVKVRAHDEAPADVAQSKVAQAEAPTPKAIRKPVHRAAPKPEAVKLAAAPSRAAAKAAAQAMADAQAAQTAHKAAAHKVELARAAQAKATAHKLELAQAAQAHRLELAQAAQAKAEAHRLQLAQAAQTAKAEKQARLHATKAQRLQQIELAKAEAKGRAEALAEAKVQALAEARADERKRERLAALAHAVQRLLPHQAKAPPPVEVAKFDRKHLRKSRHELRIEQASLKTHRPSRLVEAPPARSRVAPAAPPRASGLMKVSAPRCANRDPGEALVCADPSLSAADRQLARAYQVARAAGVPDAQLQRQQQRWLAARSAAAREAPWAVHDVYLARIAELNGQARDADEDGH